MTIKERLLNYLAKIYVPIGKRSQVENLKGFIDNVNMRMPNKNDSHKSHYIVLTIETKGKGNRETFSDYSIKNVDFDSIGEKYAMAYVYDDYGQGKPIRMNITSIKNILII